MSFRPLMCLTILAAFWCTAMAAESAPAVPVIKADTPMTAPAWALKERELMDLNGQIAKEFDRAFLLPNGYTKLEFFHGGGTQAPDDFFECIYKMPLVYALGGDDETWNVYWKAFKGSLTQLTDQKLLVNEMAKHLDWHHNGEHYEGFWLGALCAAHDAEYRRLALKYAGLYDGTDPNVPNYDPVHKVIRSMNSGGAGPILKATLADWNEEHLSDNGKKFWSHWLDCGHDGPANLNITCFGTVAFMLTGDPNYKLRTMDYLNAWRDRAKANGGMVPSIVNLDGNVPAEWWGGVMGWDFEQFGGLFQVSSGPRAAWGNALLMTGDRSYYDELRAEADEVWNNRFPSRHVKDAIDLPRYRGKDGWHGELFNGVQAGQNCAGIYASITANVYLATMKQEDLDRVLDRPIVGLAGHAFYHEGGSELLWIRYLQGQDPNYPVKALDEMINLARNDTNYGLPKVAGLPTASNEVSPKNSPQVGWAGALVNLMTGGSMPLWHGQLLQARLFYYDPQRKRPGIAEDCGALVEKLSDDSATVVLVNTNKDKARTVIVQGGAYREHQILSVTPDGGPATAVNGPHFSVELAAGAGIRLVVAMKRYANSPTLKQPWDN